MFAAHKPSENAVFWSKFERPTDPPPAHTEDAPALEPVTEDAPALEPVAAGGSPLAALADGRRRPVGMYDALFAAPPQDDARSESSVEDIPSDSEELVQARADAMAADRAKAEAERARGQPK